MLHITQASKVFGNRLVLNGLSLTVEANTIVGLAGSSGSGKSTLLRCVQQLDSLDSGTVSCSGKVGFMFQDFQLFPHLSVLSNLLFAPTLHDKTRDHHAHATALLTRLGLAPYAHALPKQLSGGQQQRVALARSLMMQPDLLLCDEPTSGLDQATIQEVITLLQSVRDMGVTMIIASHDLDFLSQLVDRLVVIQDGTIVKDITCGTLSNPTELKTVLKEYYQ